MGINEICIPQNLINNAKFKMLQYKLSIVDIPGINDATHSLQIEKYL